MHVCVGPFRYDVRLVRGFIIHEGQNCYGLCDNLRQLIQVSDIPPEPQRLQVFFHELLHAWWYHFGIEPTNEEAVADLVGVAMTDFVLHAANSLRGQGFPLPPLSSPPPSEKSANASGAEELNPSRRKSPDRTSVPLPTGSIPARLRAPELPRFAVDRAALAARL